MRRLIDYQAREVPSVQEEISKLGFRAYSAWCGDFMKHKHFEPALVVNLTTYRNYDDRRLLNLADEMWRSLMKLFPYHFRVLSGLREDLAQRAHIHQILLTDAQFTQEQLREIEGFIKGFWARHGNPLLQDIRPFQSRKAFGYVCQKNEGVPQVYKTYCPKTDAECKKRKGGKPSCPHKLT